MARRFLTNLDLVTNELQNAVIQNLATDPTSGNKDGRIYYNTTTDKLRVYANSAWQNIGDIYNIEGTTNEITVSIVNGVATIGLPDDVTITDDLSVGGDLMVTGDLTVNGTVTTVNSETVTIADNIILLNSNATATPTENAGIEVERGDSANVQLRWNESTDKWQVTEDGTTYVNIALTGDSISSSQITDFTEASQDVVGGMVSGSNSLSVSYNDVAGTLDLDTTLASTSYLSKTSGLAVDISAVETKLVTDGFTKKVSTNIGNGTNTSFAITHNLGTRDVVVNVYDNSAYDTVEVDVVRTDSNTVTITFTSAPATDAYRVVIVG
jgi:hypothetical protein